MLFSRSIHVSANDNISFFMSEKYSTVYGVYIFIYIYGIYTYTVSFEASHLLMDIWDVPVSWLLQILLL